MNFPRNPNPAPSCRTCEYLDDCGGLLGADFDKGCFQRCDLWCVDHGCDIACPSNPLVFPDMMAEIEGLNTLPRGLLANPSPSSRMPYYMPLVNHGASRNGALDEDWVVIPLYNIIGRDRRGRLRLLYDTPEKLRRGFRLAANAKIIISSVAQDHHIEAFWAQHRSRHLLDDLAGLQPMAMTVPNYSFMRDVPRTNTLYNFGRMFRMAERMTAAEIPTVVHLNAMTAFDWNIWAQVLQGQGETSIVALEFQTGAKHKEFGQWYYDSLVGLQDRLGRPLHPLILAGAGKLRELQKSFAAFSIVDSMPFIKTMKRQVLAKWDGGWKWRLVRTEEDALLDDRLDQNIAAYRTRLYEGLGLRWEGNIQERLPLNDSQLPVLPVA